MERDFYTTTELAELMGISRVAVFKKIKKGAIKAQKMGRNFVIFKKDIDIESLVSELFSEAKQWVLRSKEISPDFYCQNSDVFQARLVKMENLMMQNPYTKNTYPLITSIAGEIGNNSFDHNIGRWPDLPGIFFGFDLNKKQIVLADRGVGVLETLKSVKPELKDHKEALKVAFTENISGRRPESRGNGLKYVRNVIIKNPINLTFQTGDSRLLLKGKQSSLDIESTKENIRGCLALITY